MTFAPPPPDLMRSGARPAIARRSAGSSLRDVSAMRAWASQARASAGAHHGGTSCSSATSHSQPASAAANSCLQIAAGRRHGAAVEEVPGQDAHRVIDCPA